MKTPFVMKYYSFFVFMKELEEALRPKYEDIDDLDFAVLFFGDNPGQQTMNRIDLNEEFIFIRETPYSPKVELQLKKDVISFIRDNYELCNNKGEGDCINLFCWW